MFLWKRYAFPCAFPMCPKGRRQAALEGSFSPFVRTGGTDNRGRRRRVAGVSFLVWVAGARSTRDRQPGRAERSTCGEVACRAVRRRIQRGPSAGSAPIRITHRLVRRRLRRWVGLRFGPPVQLSHDVVISSSGVFKEIGWVTDSALVDESSVHPGGLLVLGHLYAGVVGDRVLEDVSNPHRSNGISAGTCAAGARRSGRRTRAWVTGG